MRKIIIGDVHGCLDELKLLIRKCELRKDDHIIFLGDLINKGPHSIECLEYIQFISEFYMVDLIIGNHEEKFLRFINNKNNNLEAFEQMNLKFDLYALEKNITPSILNFLRLGYFSYSIPKLGILLIHGGLTKNCKLDLQKNYRYGLHSKEELKELKLLTMTRCIDKNGDFVVLGSENEESKFWAQEYDGKHGLVLFGHQVFFQDEPMHFNNAIGLDGGCVFGGFLFAYIIDDYEKKWIRVKAMKKYVS
jgi:hypothetical protein